MMAPVHRYHLFSLMILSAFGVFIHTALWAEEASKGVDHDKGGSIVIHSDSLEIDNKQRLVTFTGHINAEMEDFVIHCEKMLLYYLEAPSSEGSGGENIQIDRIVATGQVRIIRSEGGLATAEKAVYTQADEKVILSGNPIVKQGEDTVEGSKITLYLKEKRSIVEGSDDKKVRVVISR
jgi:lipopolysaccharide export system protein LptA